MTISIYKNPYDSLGSEKFWKTAVSTRLEAKPLTSEFHFDDLWHAKFQLTRQTRFATAGSCFAQHISRWLINHDYCWIDSEPANGYMNQEDRKAGSYGVFSFRTGNIYTAALLKQWIFWALGKQEMPDEVFEQDGVFYDPFRPSIPTQGYACRQDLFKDRQTTLAAIRASLEKIDVFIFTLGLTEAWYHTEKNYVYPHCPGTIKGIFDPNQHGFINCDYNSIKQDVLDAFDAIKTINPQCRFILTVSPVPLTATASDDHVLSATTYSKSVLRAVAGALKDARDDIDYFPSYELISAYPIKAQFYEKNLRSVTQVGVDFVMQHFSHALMDYQQEHTNVVLDGDVFCEELMLQDYINKQSSDNAVGNHLYDVLIFGDSHFIRLANAFTFLKVKYIGNAVMDGSQWFHDNFALDKEEFFVPLQNKVSREKWRNSLKFFDSVNIGNKSIITNITVQSDANVQFLMFKLQKKEGFQLNLDSVINYFIDKNSEKIKILDALVQKGYQVIVITDPPVQHAFERTHEWVHLFELYEQAAKKVLINRGIQVFCPREYFKISTFPEEYFCENSEDWIHGSQDYYDEIALALCTKFNISLPFDLCELSDDMRDAVERINAYTGMN